MIRVITVLVAALAALAPLAPARADGTSLPVSQDAPPEKPAGTTGNGSWAVGPATNSKTLTPRLHFTLEGRAGDVVRDTVRIWNLTGEKMRFEVYGADGYNTVRDGAFALRGEKEPQKGVGLWTEVGSRDVTVPAGRAVDVPFIVSVPKNATPGDHIGGVVVASKEVEAVKKTGGATLGLRRAVGARIYLRLEGPLVPGAKVENLRVENTEPELPWGGPVGTVIRYRIANVGNVRLTPTAQIRATGLFGRVLRDFPERPMPELLPGEDVEVELAWPGAPPADAVKVTVELKTRAGLQSVARTGYVTLPWQTLVALLALVIAAALALRLRRHLTARRKA